MGLSGDQGPLIPAAQFPGLYPIFTTEKESGTDSHRLRVYLDNEHGKNKGMNENHR